MNINLSNPITSAVLTSVSDEAESVISRIQQLHQETLTEIRYRDTTFDDAGIAFRVKNEIYKLFRENALSADSILLELAYRDIITDYELAESRNALIDITREVKRISNCEQLVTARNTLR